MLKCWQELCLTFSEMIWITKNFSKHFLYISLNLGLLWHWKHLNISDQFTYHPELLSPAAHLKLKMKTLKKLDLGKYQFQHGSQDYTDPVSQYGVNTS